MQTFEKHRGTELPQSGAGWRLLSYSYIDTVKNDRRLRAVAKCLVAKHERQRALW